MKERMWKWNYLCLNLRCCLRFSSIQNKKLWGILYGNSFNIVYWLSVASSLRSTKRIWRSVGNICSGLKKTESVAAWKHINNTLKMESVSLCHFDIHLSATIRDFSCNVHTLSKVSKNDSTHVSLTWIHNKLFFSVYLAYSFALFMFLYI
jgi:hypothetical protein